MTTPNELASESAPCKIALEVYKSHLASLGLSKSAINELAGISTVTLLQISDLIVFISKIGRSIRPTDENVSGPVVPESNDRKSDGVGVLLDPVPYEGDGLTELDESDRGRVLVVKSPMDGLFLSSMLDKKPFVTVGTLVEPGTTFGLIEALKVFTELEIGGTSGYIVAEVFVGNGRLVHQGEDLIALLPVPQ
jgi:biotin carboxyl carrier protein